MRERNNSEERLIIAKLEDKIRFCKTKNKIINTDFLNMYEKKIIIQKLTELKFNNYILFGGYENSEMQLLILYPEKFDLEMVNKNLSNIVKVIRIVLPNELSSQYEHRDYLSAVMKVGLVRERIGDIIVFDKSAYIVVLKENSEYIKQSLSEMIRFKKSKIDIICPHDMEVKEKEFEEIDILVSSKRLDNFVSEIGNISRSNTEELIKTEKVFINSKVETKGSKLVNVGDILIIRGKGKFIVFEENGINKNGKFKIIVKKYI